MQFWDTIIHTAMMGTDKKLVSEQDLPGDLQAVYTLLQQTAGTDKELQFLQLSAAAFNYRQCCFVPLQKEIPFAAAPPEEKKYCSTEALQVLSDILYEESIPLLQIWLQECNRQQLLVAPELIPALLDLAVQHKSLQALTSSCCGKRGEWLVKFSNNWNFSMAQSPGELWQTGTPEQRKSVWKELRKNDSNKAREWLEQTWPHEDAATRADLLLLMKEGLSNADLPFLESLQTDKSRKVKEAAHQLLQQIPGSSIVQLYQQVLEQSVVLTTKKKLLGLGSKNVLEFKLPAELPENLFSYGIQKLADSTSSKTFTDEEYILSQLCSSIPPSFWVKHLDAGPVAVLNLFSDSATGQKLVQAIGNAAGKFGAAEWAIHFTGDIKTFYTGIVPLLPQKERNEYLIRHLQHSSTAGSAISLAVQEEKEWDKELCRLVMKHTAGNPYQYPRAFYNQHIWLIPSLTAGELESCMPEEEYFRSMWPNTTEVILKLLSIKNRIQHSFKK